MIVLPSSKLVLSLYRIPSVFETYFKIIYSGIHPVKLYNISLGHNLSRYGLWSKLNIYMIFYKGDNFCLLDVGNSLFTPL